MSQVSQVSMFTLAQEGVSVPSGAPAQAPAPAAPAAPGAPVVGPAPAASGTTVAPTASGGAGTAPASGSSPSGAGNLFFIVALVGLLLFFMWSGSRREKKKQEETLNALKKGSKITTVGGLIATVIEVRDSEIIVESSGTRLTFSKAAVQTVAPDESAAKG